LLDAGANKNAKAEVRSCAACISVVDAVGVRMPSRLSCCLYTSLLTPPTQRRRRPPRPSPMYLFPYHDATSLPLFPVYAVVAIG
jgi:hypothetical protein